MSTPLDHARREIAARLHEQQRVEQARQRLRRPIETIDTIIAELEELHLAGRKRVPESYEPRLRELAASVSEVGELELRSRITIVHLMDHLYAVQERLLEEKARGYEDELNQAS